MLHALHTIVSLFTVFTNLSCYLTHNNYSYICDTLSLVYCAGALQNNEVVVLELMWSNSQYTNRVLVSPSPTLLLNMKSSDEVQLDPNFAATIGIKDREQVYERQSFEECS